MTADVYDFEPARYCNGCHQVAVMPERHTCPPQPSSAEAGR